MSIKKARLIKALKIGVGVFVAITLASFLGLQNSVSAGIITLLSLQNTKKETLILAGKRLAAFFLAIVIAYICFKLFGFQVLGFAVYLFFFSIICIYAGLSDSISVCSVLISHILIAKQMPLSLVVNQFLVLLIGAGIGVLINLYSGTSVKYVHGQQIDIDGKMRNILFLIADLVEHKIDNQQLKDAIEDAFSYMGRVIVDAEQLDANFLLSDYSYYPDYLRLRSNQATILKAFVDYNYEPTETSKEEKLVAGFIRRAAKVFHECNDVGDLLSEIRLLMTNFLNTPLPKTKKEFFSHAILYGQLKDIESVILLKRHFLDSLSETQSKHFDDHCTIS